PYGDKPMHSFSSKDDSTSIYRLQVNVLKAMLALQAF
ncbi:hypothetical protein LCGC14_2882660, partial [marine sediment metagenome]